ncbi:zinc finger and SCAN domain-containing protein 25 [Boleophthalmus pectinirostris]|uniref:zinc finger and SCAN domain-containing protein 25 n=1 Tax=Boleophthalmus pectinirostris TaxID=150288 RepID=UPI00242B5396|nr:zinc finger and SCAN domain-containing protein 25 [Boleophthalmus pectinirostris]
MASRRTGFAGSMDASINSAMSRKTSLTSISDRTGAESCFDRKSEKPAYGATQGSMTVTSLKSRLAPTIHTAMSAAVDALLGEVVIVLNETQLELVHKEEENERLKVRLEVSERELKTLQDCLSSAQKLIDQLQISYSGAHVVSQSVFAPSLSSMTSLASSMERDPQNPRIVSGPDLGLGGSVTESLQGFGPNNDYKMCQLSIQPDGSVTNHSLDSFGSNTSHVCSNSRSDESQSQGLGLAHRFEIKEEQRPVPASVQSNRKEASGEGEQRNPEHGFIQTGGEGASQRSFPQPLRLQRSVRDCNAAMPPGGLSDQKMVSGTSVGSSLSPGRAEDTAGPSGVGVGVGPSADRPHHCLECGKTFRLISSLKKHIRIHTGEKPYPCGVCGRRFRESGALKTHLRIHTGEKPYSCSECGTCFRHLDGLRKHRRTHTGEKPYVCGICGKRLSRLQHLKHHQLIHTGERPCCCPFCNRTFKEPAALRKHVRTHRDMGIGTNEDQQEPIDDMNNLHPAAPSPQMRFEEWGAEEEDNTVVDCV